MDMPLPKEDLRGREREAGRKEVPRRPTPPTHPHCDLREGLEPEKEQTWREHWHMICMRRPVAQSEGEGSAQVNMEQNYSTTQVESSSF